MTNFRSAAIATGNAINDSAYDNVKIVVDSIGNVNTVGSAIDAGAFDIVSANVADVNIIANNIASVLTTAGIAVEVQSVAANKVTLDSIFADKATLDSIFADKVTLDSLFTDKAVLDSLYADKAKLDSLYADKIALDRIYASIDSVDINVNNIANINIAADNISDVNAVSTDIASVIAAATNIADITNFADVYQGSKPTEPTTRNDMTALVEGDMYFDTTIDRLRAYSGTVWITIAIIEHADLLGLQGGTTGDYQHLTTAQLAKVANIPDNTDLILGTTTLTRFDKILGSMNIVDMEYTSGDLVTVRYEGDNDTNVFYRDVLAYVTGDLVTVKHYCNTADLVTESGLTTLVYDVNKNLIGSNYTEG